MRGKKSDGVFCSRKKANRFPYLFGKRTWIFLFTSCIRLVYFRQYELPRVGDDYGNDDKDFTCNLNVTLYLTEFM